MKTRIQQALEKAQKRIESLISSTPTGEERNRMTEENIELLYLILDEETKTPLEKNRESTTTGLHKPYVKEEKEEKVPIDQVKVDMVEVTGANVQRIGHNEKQEILAIEFVGNSLFYYLDVPRIHFTEMLKCDSIGSYLHRNIKGTFRYVKIK